MNNINEKTRIPLKAKLTATAAGIGLCALLTANSYFVADTINTKIVDTEVKHSKYLILTEDGAFENTDVWYRLKFDSSDLQSKAAKLKDKNVTIKKYGWRFGPTSSYENALEIEEIKKSLPY